MSLYKPNEYCLDFEKSEIEAILLIPLKAKYPDLIFPVWGERNDEDIDRVMSLYKPEEICLDYDRPDIKEHFTNIFKDEKGWHISLIPGDQLDVFTAFGSDLKISYDSSAVFFMFCDDGAKKNLGFDETFGNVVYQGTLRNKTHKEILTLVKDFIELLLGTEEIRVDEKQVRGEIDYDKRICKVPMFPEWEAGHFYCYYDVYLKKTKSAASVQFENITFHIVESLK